MKDTTHSLRSALSRARGLGSAKSGVLAWLDLRMTAVALIPLSLYAVITFINNVVAGGYSGAIYWLQSPLAATLVLLFLLVGFRHGASGIKEVIEDYVHTEYMKFGLLLVVHFSALALTILGALSVAKIYLGV